MAMENKKGIQYKLGNNLYTTNSSLKKIRKSNFFLFPQVDERCLICIHAINPRFNFFII